MKNIYTPEKQEEYIDQVEEWIHYCDLDYDDEQKASDLKSTIPWLDTLQGVIDSIDKLPSPNALIPWEIKHNNIDKESKMYLCDLPLPSERQIVSFRANLKRFFNKIKLPSIIEIPHEEELFNPDEKKIFSNGNIMMDCEDPLYSHGRFLYQDFMTAVASPREVWLPSKEYKIKSKFWHLVTKEILKGIPYCALDLSEDAISELVLKRKTGPVRTLDIKGFGLQFPREYIKEIISLLCELYPQLKFMEESTLGILDSIEVEVGNNIIKPNRGVGLGYFTNLMVLAVYTMLQDFDIIASFADDTLIDYDDYNEARSNIEWYGLPINEKKSGKTWVYHTYFVGNLITEVDTHLLLHHSSELNSIFNQRYYWERKHIISNLPTEWQVIAAYHTERLIGYEFYRGESLTNLNDGGSLSCIPEEHGCSRSKYACDTYPITRKLLWKLEAFPGSLPLETRKDLHTSRKTRWLSKIRKEHSDLDVEVVIPESPYPRMRTYLYPDWAERTQINQNVTSGNTVYDLSDREVSQALVGYSASENPISSFMKQEIWYNYYPTTISDEDKERFIRALSCEPLQKNLGLLETPTSQVKYGEIKIDEVTPIESFLSPVATEIDDNRKVTLLVNAASEDDNSEELDSVLAYDSDFLSVSSIKTHESEKSW